MSKKKFKMPSAYTILFFIIVIVAILTWVIPAGEYQDGVYKQIDPNPQGIYNILSAPIAGFFDAVDIALFIIVIGGFLGIVLKTGAITAGIASIIAKLKGKEILLVPILMILFGIGGTTYGMAEETIAFYPILIPVFLVAGYDVVTAVAVILLGAGIGVLSSTVNPFATGVASSALDISLGEGIFLRAAMLIVLEAIGIIYVMRYAKKVKKDPTTSLVHGNLDVFKLGEGYDHKQEKLTKSQAAVLILFALTFIIMIVGVIPWEYKFEISFFSNIYNKLADIKILGFEPNTAEAYWDHYDANKVQSAALGDWWFGQMTVLFFIMSIVIGFVGKMSEKEIANNFMEGARDLISVALIVGLSRGIKVIMVAGGMDATVLHWGQESLKGFSPVLFSILSYVFYIPMSFLIPSTSGLANASMPIMGPLAGSVFEAAGKSAVLGKSIMITAYQSASGIVNLITPTSGVVMGGLAIAKLPYEKWLKYVGKLLGLLFIATCIFLAIGVLIGG